MPIYSCVNVKLLTTSVNAVSVWGGLALREILASDGEYTYTFKDTPNPQNPC